MRLSCEFPQPPRFALAYGFIAPKTVDNHRLRARALHGITNGLITTAYALINRLQLTYLSAGSYAVTANGSELS